MPLFVWKYLLIVCFKLLLLNNLFLLGIRWGYSKTHKILAFNYIGTLSYLIILPHSPIWLYCHTDPFYYIATLTYLIILPHSPNWLYCHTHPFDYIATLTHLFILPHSPIWLYCHTHPFVYIATLTHLIILPNPSNLGLFDDMLY